MRPFAALLVLGSLACGPAKQTPHPPRAADDSAAATATTSLTQVPAGATLTTLDAVNLRDAASSTAKVQTVLDEDTELQATTGTLEGGTWLEVHAGNRQGFVFAPYVTPSACAKLADAADHLRSALSHCARVGDDTAYWTSRTACEKATASCSAPMMGTLETLATCELSVPTCATPDDRGKAVRAIEACLAPLEALSDPTAEACLSAQALHP